MVTTNRLPVMVATVESVFDTNPPTFAYVNAPFCEFVGYPKVTHYSHYSLHFLITTPHPVVA
jgi:hypothetical protein